MMPKPALPLQTPVLLYTQFFFPTEIEYFSQSILSASLKWICPHLTIKLDLPSCSFLYLLLGFPGGTSGKEPICQCRRHKRHGFGPWVRRSPGEGHSSPLQYSYLDNVMDRGAWWATIQRVTKSRTQLQQLSMHVPIIIFIQCSLAGNLRISFSFQLFFHFLHLILAKSRTFPLFPLFPLSSTKSNSHHPHHLIIPLLFSHLVMSDSLQTHGLQHTSPPCPWPSSGVCPSSYSLHQWCCPAASSSDILFSFCPQSFLASWTFPVSHLFASDDQILELQLQHQSFQWIFRVDLSRLISLLSKGLSGVFSSTTVQRHQFFGVLPSFFLEVYSLEV